MGSLPRSVQLQELVREREDGGDFDPERLARSSRRGFQCSSQAAERQDRCVNNGEQDRSQYATCVKGRLTGFEGDRIIRARPSLDDAGGLTGSPSACPRAARGSKVEANIASAKLASPSLDSLGRRSPAGIQRAAVYCPEPPEFIEGRGWDVK